MSSEINRKVSFRALLEGLLHDLEKRSYSQLTRDNYRRTLRKIEPFMHSIGIGSYTPETGIHYFEFYIKNNKMGISRQVAIMTAIRRLNDFYAGNEYQPQWKHSISSLTVPFEEVLEQFARKCEEAGNKKITVDTKRRFARSFLRACHALGCPDPVSLNASCITRACLAIKNKDVLAVARAFLKFSSFRGITERDFSTLVPRTRRPIPIPTSYSEEEILQFETVIDRSSKVGMRDYAMLLLATRLGMRSGDITKLSLDELDFEHEEISFRQEKNGERLHLPMISEVRIALIDYLDKARPKVLVKTVFLRHIAPYQGITTSVLRFVTTKYLKLANIDISEKKHGPHTFRSSLASSMVNGGTPYEVVRTILGHSKPNAIKHYAKLNIEKLRECAIQVPDPMSAFKAFLEGSVS